MATSKPFDELSTELRAARDAAAQRLHAERAALDTAVAKLGGAISWDPGAFENAIAAEAADAQAAFDSAIAENEARFMGWALRELTARARAFREKGDRETASAFLSKLRQCGAEKQRLIGRTLGEYGCPSEAWLAFAATFVHDLPNAIVAFTDPAALSSTKGTPEAVDRVLRAAAHAEDAGEAVEALAQLEACCARIASSAPNVPITDEIQKRWQLACSGKAPAVRQQALQELEAARQKRDRAGWEERRDRIRLVRAGDVKAREGLSGEEVSQMMGLSSKIFGHIGEGVTTPNPWRKGA